MEKPYGGEESLRPWGEEEGVGFNHLSVPAESSLPATPIKHT